MRVGNFSLLIPQGRERSSGHVELTHGAVYALHLRNHDYGRACDAEVVVDGKALGIFRIDAGGSITLERPVHDTGRLTFYRASSAEGEAAGSADVAAGERGLVQVVFRPGRRRPSPTVALPRVGHMRGPGGQSAGAPPDFDEDVTERGPARGPTRNLSAGVTGLSGTSHQAFTSATPIDYDPGAEVTITVRLVAADDGPRPLTAAPPPVRANPVPDPVE